MNWYKRISFSIRREWVLFSILAFAFFSRVVGIGYGLPLTVVSDESTFTLGALLMIKLHTVLPALHPEFQSILYYPPYLSYILLAPFTIILGVQYVLSHGDPGLFQTYVVTHLSPFYIAARLLSVSLGILSVYLIYRIAVVLFRSRIAALGAAFLLATSISHVALSMVGRQWLPVSAVIVIVLYILSRESWSLKKRYIAAFAIAGVGMGISSICALACVLIGIYYFCFDVPRFRHIVRDGAVFLSGACAFMVLAAVAWFAYHGGLSFVDSITIFQPKSLGALLVSPWSVISLIVLSEPVLVALATLGLVYCAFREKRVGALIAGFFILYAAIFYLFFRIESRFFLPLVPFLSLSGGYAIAQLWSRRSAVVLFILLSVPLFAAVRFSYLAAQGDTRLHAREWVLEHLTPGDRVLVYSSAIHVPTQAAAVQELRAIDPSALRQVDQVDEILDRHDVPYVLNNLKSLTRVDFLKRLAEYAHEHDYTYLVLEPNALLSVATTTKEAFASLTKSAPIVAHFDGFGATNIGPTMSIGESTFTQPFTVLFEPRSLGTDIVIYRLRE